MIELGIDKFSKDLLREEVEQYCKDKRIGIGLEECMGLIASVTGKESTEYLIKLHALTLCAAFKEPTYCAAYIFSNLIEDTPTSSIYPIIRELHGGTLTLM